MVCLGVWHARRLREHVPHQRLQRRRIGRVEGPRPVAVDVEHRDLEPITWFLTYRHHRGRYQFGDANGEGVLQKGEPAIFADEGDEPEVE